MQELSIVAEVEVTAWYERGSTLQENRITDSSLGALR